jgi:hypothetical protein
MFQDRLKLFFDHKIEYEDYKQKSVSTYEKLFISFDEEHELMKNLLFKSRIESLAEHHHLMFLSATPSVIAYKLCDGKAVANLSRTQKINQLGSQSISSDTLKAQRLPLDSYSFVDWLKSGLVDILEKERISCAHTYIDKSELAIFYRDPKNKFYISASPDSGTLRHFSRWNIQCPMSEKALILVSHGVPLINLNLVLKGELDQPFQRGNRVNRGQVFSLLQLGPNLDELNLDRHRMAKLKQRQRLLTNYLKTHHPQLTKEQITSFLQEEIDFSETHDYLRYRIYHGMIETTLSYLTGFNHQTLNKMRHADLQSLVHQIQNKLQNHTHGLSSISDYLTGRGLSLSLADKIAPLIESIILMLQEDSGLRERIIDNWPLDKMIHQTFDQKKSIKEWAERHKTIYSFKKLQATNIKVNQQTVFTELKEIITPLSQAKISGQATHELSPLEILNPHSTWHSYETESHGDVQSIEDADILFKLGMIGAYVTRERASGFNDENLHHVALLLSTNDTLNTPEQIIQVAGRLRGLDPAHYPYFILAEDEGVSHTFDPNTLNNKEYLQSLLSARAMEIQQKQKQMSVQIAENIIHLIQQRADPLGWIDPIVLHETIHNDLLDQFEILYNEKNHDAEQTRIQFIQVLTYVGQHLQASAQKAQKRYTTTWAQQSIAYQIDCLVNLQYNNMTQKIRQQITDALEDDPADSIQRIYVKMITMFNLRKITTHITAMNRMLDVMSIEIQSTIQFLGNNPLYLLNEASQHALREGFIQVLANKMLPLLNDPSLQNKILHLLETSDINWPLMLCNHMDLFEPMDENQKDILERKINKFFSIIKRENKIAVLLANSEVSLNANINALEAEVMSAKFRKAFSAFTQEKVSATEDIKKLLTDKKITFLLDTAFALFLIENIDVLNYESTHYDELVETLKTKDIESIRSILSKGLPESLTSQIPPSNKATELKLSEYLNSLKSDFNSMIDADKANEYCHIALERYINSQQYHELCETIFQPFTQNELTFILSVLYKDANDSELQIKQALIEQFLQDLKALPPRDLLKKYANLDGDQKDFTSTQLFQVHQIMMDVLNEILLADCYYLGVTQQGDTLTESELIAPKLKEIKPHHAVWHIHRTPILENHRSELSWPEKQNKIQPLLGILDAFSAINDIESTKDTHLQKQLHLISKTIIEPLKNSITKGLVITSRGHIFKTPKYFDFKKSPALAKSILFFSGYSRSEVMYKSQSEEEPDIVDKIRKDLYRNPPG